MIPATTTVRPQIFLSFALADRRLAEKITDTLQRSGLKVVSPEELEPGREYSKTIRDALLKSAAIVVVLSGQTDAVPASVLFEIGAAFGAEKPIFVIVDKPDAKLPFETSKLRILPLSRTKSPKSCSLVRDDSCLGSG
jgi:nucleoside 2-deoxyribosyltransferase